MGGFAAALGGFGTAASEYSQQMRQLLEQRRGAISDALSRAAAADPNQQTSMEKRQAAIDALNKPMGSVVQSLGNLIKKHVQDNQKLHSGLQTISQLPGAQPQQQGPAPTPAATQVGDVAGAPPKALTQGAAAQPANNPIAGPIGPIGATQSLGGPDEYDVPPVAPAAASASAPAPVAATGSVPPITAPVAQAAPPLASLSGTAPVSGASPSGVPDIYSVRQKRADILAKYEQQMANTSAAFQPGVQARMKEELDALQPLEQVAERQMQFEQFKQTPEYANLPPTGKAYAAMQAYGLQPYAPPSSTFRPEAKVVDVERMTPEDRVANGIPADAKGPYTTYTDVMSGRPAWQAQPARVSYAEVAGPNGVDFMSRLPGATLAGGGPAMPLSSLNPIGTGVDSTGHNVYQTRGSLVHPGDSVNSVLGAGFNSSMLPTQHTSEPTATGGTVSRTAKQLPSAIKGLTNGHANSGSGNSAPAANPDIAPIDNKKDPATDLVKMTAGDILQGTESFDKLKPGMQTAVKQYMIRNHILMPISVTAAGQKTLSTVTPVIQQIDDLTSQLADAKKNNANLILAYKEYSLGHHTPYDALFTGAAFERLRSASQALSGVGSRSYQVLEQGLQHTPNFDRLYGFNPDDIQEMTDKLQTAKKILTQERDAVSEYQRKSGVVPPPGDAIAPARPKGVPAAAQWNAKSRTWDMP